MATPSALKKAGVLFLLCAATAIAARAQVFTTLVSFYGGNGSFPYYVSLAQGTDGNLHGTTRGGNRPSFPGTIFTVTPGGSITVLDTFCGSCQGGDSPLAGLVLAADGNFYGSTAGYDLESDGTVFKVNARGTLTTLHRFHYADGIDPEAALLLAADGIFYGTTFYGGTNSSNCNSGCGTVFKITSEGTLTTLHRFDYTDGAGPVGALVQGLDGSLYGTTCFGGANGYGTVFRLTPGKTLTTLHDFDLADGATPFGGVVLANDGNFYGTTSDGGVNGKGTVFKITPGGKLTTLYSFCAGLCADGATPYAGLMQGTDGNFYGTTWNSGANFDGGTVFKITPEGNLTTLHSFCALVGCHDGARPYGGLVQSTNGILYGMTWEGGSRDDGAVFSLDMGLGPFVTFVRFAGQVGETGPILGQGFTGTTSVSLNGIPASFTVVSDTFIRATVPAGAKTGYVTVTTRSGTLTSNVPFHVIP